MHRVLLLVSYILYKFVLLTTLVIGWVGAWDFVFIGLEGVGISN